MTLEEVYVSVDIEADGPIPGPHSMLSIGSVAFTIAAGEIGSFSANLETLPGASMDPVTKSEFWDKQPEAWAACRRDPQPLQEAMTSYAAWVRSLPGKPVFVGYPATFDHAFVHWYLVRFTGSDPFGFEALDIKSYAMATLRSSFQKATKRSMPAEWVSSGPLSHVAVDDARVQGEMFMHMLKANLGVVE